MIKIAVIGANGQLGTDIVAELNKDYKVFPINHTDLEIKDLGSVMQVFESIRPDIIINTAAYHNVPVCESNPIESFRVNGLGAKYVGEIADKLKARVIYFSTDYVFDGQKMQPYTETDLPNPLNVYGATKLMGEYNTLNYCDKSTVLRVSGLYGTTPCRAKGGNFITKIISAAKNKPEIRVVVDEILAPTWTKDIAQQIRQVIDHELYGIYHFVAEGGVSWYEFTRYIFDYLGIDTPLYQAHVGDFPAPVKRPTYSVLSNVAYNTLGLNPFRTWDSMLSDFLKNL